MKRKNNIKRFICAVLCLCMLFGTLLNLASCGDGDETEGGGTEAGDETVSVLRYVKDAAKGDKVVKSAIQVVNVQKKNVPEDALTTESEALGKYLVEPVCAGEFVVSRKLSAKHPNSSTKNEDGSVAKDYLIVTEHISISGSISDSLQELIDKNPGRTLYFPDGLYRFDKTVTTSSDPAKSVSFEFSTYAQLTPADNWSGKLTDPILNIGGGGDGSGAVESKAGNECFVKGGIIYAQKKCSGITVEGTGRVFIHNMSMKETHIGIDVKADYTDIDNVVITGTNTADSIGVLVESSYNTLTNMRIFRINTGIKLLEGRNVLRNLHPLYAGTDETSCGFWDLSEGNYYDICYSDHFAVGFRMTSNTVSVYNGCFAYWYNGGYSNGTKVSHEKHWGFECNDATTLAELGNNPTGEFNSIIRNTRVDLNYSNCDSTYLRIYTQGGQGLLLDPTCVGGGGDDHASDYSAHLKTEKH